MKLTDILPVLELGGFGIHIPFHITWIHEQVEHSIEHERFFSLENNRLKKLIVKNKKRPSMR